ncbi:hypothetical protein V3851_07970 [Paenibacillus sp. M1]|uniref:Uncharacterized protein n=1 Tax=Paenibacillus haidiansis TaxID=1574488 RepID=A0ABU7VSB6_9BACL
MKQANDNKDSNKNESRNNNAEHGKKLTLLEIPGMDAGANCSADGYCGLDASPASKPGSKNKQD